MVSWCLGHLAEYAAPEHYDERYENWRFEDLPISSIGSIRKFAMCWNIAVVFRQQKRRKVQYEVCKLYPDTSLEEPSK